MLELSNLVFLDASIGDDVNIQDWFLNPATVS